MYKNQNLDIITTYKHSVATIFPVMPFTLKYTVRVS